MHQPRRIETGEHVYKLAPAAYLSSRLRNKGEKDGQTFLVLFCIQALLYRSFLRKQTEKFNSFSLYGKLRLFAFLCS
jgi:hypothetical protein